jgi:hypothetical protein
MSCAERLSFIHSVSVWRKLFTGVLVVMLLQSSGKESLPDEDHNFAFE